MLELALFCSAVFCQEQKPDRNFEYSVAALAATTVADTASSWGRNELNPVLGTGRFGVRQAALKAAIVGGVLLFERVAQRRNPKIRRLVTKINFVMAGVTGGVAAHNWRRN